MSGATGIGGTGSPGPAGRSRETATSAASEPPRGAPESIARRRPAWLAGAALLGLILAAGLALRLYRLGDLPFGLHTDEGHNALDALRILREGWRPVFLERNNGREPLFMYLMAATMGLAGADIRGVRLAGVVAAGLVILAQWGMTRALPLSRPRRVALLSAAFLALGFWPLAQARYALRANLLPFWVAGMLWAWWRCLERHLPPDPPQAQAQAPPPEPQAPPIAQLRALAYPALTGVCLAGALHTHLTGRLLPLILVLSALWVLLRERRPRVLADLAIAGLVALALAWPQIRFFMARPEMLGYRAEQVSLFNPEINEGSLGRALAENAGRLLAAPVWSGDSSWYHNLERRPIFAALPERLAFLAGLVVLAGWLLGRRGRARQTAGMLLTLALAVTAAPSLLSVGAPNYVRLTGTWPVLYLLPALGLDRAAAWLEARARRERSGSGGTARAPGLAWAGPGLILLTLAWTGARTAVDYFGRYVPRPEVAEAFNAAAVARGQALARAIAAEPGAQHFVSPALWQQSVIRFLNQAAPPTAVDPRAGLVLPPPGIDAHYSFDPVEAADAAAFGARWPMAREEPGLGAEAGNLIHFVLDAESLAALAAGVPSPPAPVTFGPNIRLAGIALAPAEVTPGGSLSVTLLSEALAPTSLDHNRFLHLLSAAGGQGIGQHDGPPLAGSYGTEAWRPGQRILETLALPVAADAPPGPAVLRLGWYDWRDGARLPVPGSPDGAAEAGTITVRP